MLYLLAFTTGLVGSLHCLGMCGPLMLALPTGQMSPAKAAGARAGYTLGRIGVYAALGTVSGWLGWRLSLRFVPQAVSIGAGTLLLAAQLPLHRLPFRPWQALYHRVRRALSHLTHRRTLAGITTLGVVNGLLPCGMVYAALAGAAATATPLNGGAYMALFGLGTAPALWLVSLAKSLFSLSKRPFIRRLMPYFGGVVALLLIGRGYLIHDPLTASPHAIPRCIGHPGR